MGRKKWDELEKSEKNLKQQIRHTEDRIQDTEFALEHESMSEGRRKELRIKNIHRREDLEDKKRELES